MAMTRRHLAFVMMTAGAWMIEPVAGMNSRTAAFAFTPEGGDERVQKNDVQKEIHDNVINGAVNGDYTGDATLSSSSVAYRSLSIPVPNYNNVKVPVAVWYPTTSKNNDDETKKSPIMDYPSINSIGMKNGATYSHRISVKKIGKMLAGWDFIPDFASKDFVLQPTNPKVQLSDEDIPKKGPLVLLAHGYLGSRFDLSHLAESLAQQGFTCMSVEYPESLAASYDVMEGLDRTVITQALLEYVKNVLQITPSSYGIVGHSLGCGTVLTTGDDSWTRVCIAGPPVRRSDGVSFPKTLLIASVNDGAVNMERIGPLIPTDFVRISPTIEETALPKKAAFIFENKDSAPNHISFLADGTNQAMIEFLSPLLPVAQVLGIPVLDFDKYKISQDSQPTANVVIPLVTSYLKQNMSL